MSSFDHLVDEGPHRTSIISVTLQVRHIVPIMQDYKNSIIHMYRHACALYVTVCFDGCN